MVVDDSAVVRGLFARWLTESGEFDVVATAANGALALQALDRVAPEIVLLDLDMPGMDGVEALPLLLRSRPELRVIVVSSLTPRNAALSLRCLALGAMDCIAKPQSRRQVATSLDFRSELLRKAGALARRACRLRPPPPLAAVAPRPARRAAMPRPQCLLIGASTGGPRAVEEVLAAVGPALRQLPTLVVQHMPAVFTAVFADYLGGQLALRVREPEHGEPLVPGTVYIAPGGLHMGLSGSRGAPLIRLDGGPAVNFCRPAVDVLFRDAAAIFGSAALAVVLTGMGCDGTQGARLLVRAGATVLAQDEATSIIWGMPGSVARAGLAREVLPLAAIGPTLKAAVTGSGE